MEVFENALQTTYLSYSCGRGFFLSTEKISVFENIRYGWKGPEFKWASSEKEILWMNSLTYDHGWRKIYDPNFMFRTQDPNIKTSVIRRICAKIHNWSTIHCVFKFHDLSQKSIIGMLFKANSVDPVTSPSPPPGVAKPMEAISEALFLRPLYLPKQL